MSSTSATRVLILGPEIVCGLSFSRSLSDSEGFSPGSPFPPSAKSTPSLFHLAVVLCSEVIHGSLSGAERLTSSTVSSFPPRRAAPLAIHSLRLRVRAFSRSGILFHFTWLNSFRLQCDEVFAICYKTEG